ncbi:WASH complex subunit 2A-like isoform X2 [Bufo bufo]|uniref:WASH complex subunit 2A-like isoform X2 n=1 Tax=Bufo bufo TaxID=8384 RepID=UPI001ABE3CB3|nr:WASH complex subunit 2A-like isoform X2 [Bufo bufo]
MNGPVSAGPEELVWERPWSLEEIGRSSQNWSLAADAGLLHFLQEFSHQTISRTHEIEKQLDGLVHEAKTSECRLHNIFNDFLMLSNTQFIENRVYDEEVEEHVVKSDAVEKPEPEKTREQKEVELIPKIQEAVNYGLQVLETAFEQLDIKAGNSDSEDEEVNERVELILEPKDLYIDRPLPYLIGSQLFMQQEDVGLGDLSSEEGSVDNDRGSVIDSEKEDDKDNEEDSEEDFGNNSEEEGKSHHPALSDEDEDNGSDLFGDSDKEDEEENDKSIKTRTRSFADELAARIQSEIPKRQETDQPSISSIEVKSKKEKETREVRNLPSDDEEDDIFKPPKLTDEDFFGNKGGLFSGGKGLFDDDDEDDGGEGDLFSDVQKKEPRMAEAAPVARPETFPSDVKKKPPYGGVSLFPGGENVISSSVLSEKEKRKPPTPNIAPKPSASADLFDDDDVIFGAAPTPPSGKAKPASDLFADEDDLFDNRSSISSAAVKSKETEASTHKTLEKKSLPIPAEKTQPSEPPIKKQTKGLFSDEEDSESDLFSPSQAGSKPKTASAPATRIGKSLSLFDDEDDDIFGSVPEKAVSSAASKPVQKSTIPAEVKNLKSGFFSSDEEDLVTQPASIKPTEKSKKDAAVPPKPKKEEKSEQKRSLFDDDDDLFAITKESQKTHRVSLLFEDDVSTEEPLFSSGITKTLEQPKTPVPVKEENGKASLADDTDKKAEPKGKVQAVEETLPPVQDNNMVKPVPFEESDGEDLFASSSPPQPAKQASKMKSKNVLSLFGDEEDDMEDQFAVNIIQHGTVKDSVDKSGQWKSTGVFQDEELLFSQELQKDNDPDVDLFANKKSSERPKSTKLSTGAGLFCEDDNEDLFRSAKPKIPPRVQEKKIVIKKESKETSKESGRPLGANEVTKTEETEKTTDPAPIKTKSPSSRIGKLQENLLINPAALLPGAVPKLSGARAQTSAPEDNLASKNLGGTSFETPAQVDTLHNANKTRVKVGGKRRPPTRIGRKVASQDSGDNEDALPPISPTSAAKPETGPAESNWRTDREEISTMKLSFSENDIQPRTHRKAAVNPLTPDVNDFFGSDLFADNSVPKPVAPRQQKEESPGGDFSEKPFLDPGKKSSAVLFGGDGSDDDLFKSRKDKAKKTPQPTSLIDKEPEDDLFGFQKPPKKVDTQSVVPKETSAASDMFEDDIFAAEAIKPVKKAKEKKGASEASLFDDNADIFADFTQNPKEKKSKKKAEPKSIFNDDMDDIFSASVPSVKKTKSKSKSSQQGSETKPDAKVSTAFDDPLNALGK